LGVELEIGLHLAVSPDVCCIFVRVLFRRFECCCWLAVGVATLGYQLICEPPSDILIYQQANESLPRLRLLTLPPQRWRGAGLLFALWVVIVQFHAVWKMNQRTLKKHPLLRRR
jgi:hypothetical protein